MKDHPEFPDREVTALGSTGLVLLYRCIAPLTREDQRLYKVWVKFTEKETESQKRSMTVEREADIDPDHQVLLPSASTSTAGLQADLRQPGHEAKGKGKGKNTADGLVKPKKEPKEKKPKTPAQQTKQVRFLAQLQLKS